MNVPEEKVFRLPRRPFKKRYYAQEMERHKAAFMLQTIRIWCSLFSLLFTRSGQYDLVYCFGAAQLSQYAVLIARLLHKKAIVSSTFLGVDDPLSIYSDTHVLKRRFRSLVFSLINGYISISRPITEASHKAGFPENKLWEIPNPVDTNLFSPCGVKKKKMLRNKLGIKDDTFALLLVGSDIRRKGVNLIVEALGLLSRRYANIKLFVVGSRIIGLDDEEQFLQELDGRINMLGLAEKVKFVGLVGNVHLYMKACDVFVFPSRSEGFGTVLVEAMASGLPIVTGEILGIAEYIITHKKDGFIVDYSAEAIAEAVEKLYGDIETRYCISHNAVQTARTRFSIEVIDAQYDQVYAAVLRRN
jgi:glycosyltransferase involved in cell wall biosynthesis